MHPFSREPSPAVYEGRKVSSPDISSIFSFRRRCSSEINRGVAAQRSGFLSKSAVRPSLRGGEQETFCRA